MKRILLFFVGGCAVIAIIALVAFFGMFMAIKDEKTVNTDSIQKVRQKELDRIKNLPEIKAVITDDNLSFSPFNHKPVAVSLIKIGTINSYKYSRFKRSLPRVSGRPGYVYEIIYNRDYQGYGRDSINVTVNNLAYKLSLNDLFVTTLPDDAIEKDKLGVEEVEFKTDYNINTTLLVHYKFSDNPKMTPEQREYFRKHKILTGMLDKFPEMKGYDLYWKDRKGYYSQGEPQWKYGFAMMVYNLRKGDTLKFKGILKNNKIVKLY
ncbi:hypothetical protein [Flavobacterium wongokense]|uniref:hypothetical protein n=1 Tax=Flavobacterium wongokense TaxID=2910674 RepID=UPI001F2F6026|nr:hypothetical protein [Flavobacterium sp. WG47]MCF6130656.1 hypothetical protein [Flavobacterium sp. WG47]